MAKQKTVEEMKIEALEAALAEKQTVPTPSVQSVQLPIYKGYQFTCARFYHNWQYYNASDAVKNEALMKELIALEAGFLKKI